MNEGKFEEFRQLVFADESLQKELRDITDRAEFVTRLIALGNDHGYQFAPEHVDEALRTARRNWIGRGI